MTDQSDPDTDTIRRTGPEERDYLLQRAEGHRQLAEKTEESGAKMIHARMKQLYEERASAIDVVDTDQYPPQEYQERDLP